MTKRDLGGVTVEPCGERDLYTGTKDALVAKGIARPEWFPGDPACPRKCTYRTPDKRIEVHRRNKKLFDVLVELPEEEKERRERLEESRRAMEKARQHIAALPGSSKDYREWLKGVGGSMLRCYRDLVAAGSGGFTVSQEILDAIDEAHGEIFEAIDTAPINYSAKERTRRTREILGEAMPDDPAFRSFLAGIVDASPDTSQD